jgi:LysM repeat protein
MYTYVIQPGDTLGNIAYQYGTTVQAIMQMNGIVNPDLIYVGQTIMIPVSGQSPILPAPFPGFPGIPGFPGSQPGGYPGGYPGGHPGGYPGGHPGHMPHPHPGHGGISVDERLDRLETKVRNLELRVDRLEGK